MKTIIDKETGKKMYPVGKWRTYQHVFYNYSDRCYNKMIDDEYSDASVKANEEAERLLDVFESNIHDGMVYALYEDYSKMKDIIGAYAWRHNGTV